MTPVIPERLQDLPVVPQLALNDRFPVAQGQDPLRAGTMERLVEFLQDYLTTIFKDGVDGKSVQLRVTDTMLQWRLEGAVTWLDLFPLSTLEELGAEQVEAINNAGTAKVLAVNVAGDLEVAAITSAAATRIAEILSTPGFDTLYPNAYTTALPKGVTSGTVGGTAITGATPGTYALTAVGGSITGVAADLVVTSPTAASIVVTNPGLGTGTTPPTWANPAGATLPVGATLTAVVGNRVPTTGRYLALSADGLSLQCYQNDGTATPAALAGVSIPTASEVSRIRGLLPRYSGRSGVSWALLDRIRRKLRYVSLAGVGYSNIPEVFNKAVTFVQRLLLTRVTLGDQSVDYVTGYGKFRSGWVRAWVDSKRRVLFGVRTNGRVYAFGKELLSTSSLSTLALPQSNVADAYGDSLTFGTGATTGWVARLASKIGGGFVINNYGVGGQGDVAIAMRAGVRQTRLTVSGNTIPSGTSPVTVTHINGVALHGANTAGGSDVQLLSTAAQNNTTTITGTLCGIRGTLTRTASGGPPSTTETYTFTPVAGSLGAACPAESVFTLDTLANSMKREAHLCWGRNSFYGGGAALTQIIESYDRFIAANRNAYKRIFIYGVINSRSEPTGHANHTVIVALNKMLRERYPAYYVVDSLGRDLRERLVASGTGTGQDATDAANDVQPLSLSADGLHLNDAGYEVWATLAKEFRDTTI